LCRLHHRLVHEGEIAIETLADGAWRFLHPDGRHFELIRCSPDDPCYDGEELETTHAELGIHIDSDTAATRWRGERMDYELGVWVLCNQANRARAEVDAPAEDDVAAETSDNAKWQPDDDPYQLPWWRTELGAYRPLTLNIGSVLSAKC
jgi:hypothetical protein